MRCQGFSGGCGNLFYAMLFNMETAKRKRGRPATGRRPKVSFSLDAVDLERARAVARLQRRDVASVVRVALAEFLRRAEGVE